MKVYIASPIIRMAHINKQIYCAIKNELQLDVFLPISIHDEAISNMDMKCIADICYTEIEQREIIVVVGSFGLSVAAEIGYAIYMKNKGDKKFIIFYCYECNELIDKEAMLIPFFDFRVDSIQGLIELLRNLTTIPEQKASTKLSFDGTKSDR
jgi:hypothetical protein